MSEHYPGTSVPFESYALADLHDPVVLGPGSESLQATSQIYGSLAETLDKAVGDLDAVLVKSQHAQQGQAADAARQHILKVASAGEAGAEQSRLATYALQEQAAYFARARTDMVAAADTAATPVPVMPPAGKGGPVPSPQAKRRAADRWRGRFARRRRRPSSASTSSPRQTSAGASSHHRGRQRPVRADGRCGRPRPGHRTRRPSWLVEDDPEALWMSGLPPHGPAVIEPLED